MFPKPLKHTADLLNAFFRAIRYIVLIVQLVDTGDIGVVGDHVNDRIRGLRDQRIEPGHDRIEVRSNAQLQAVNGGDDISRLSVALVCLVLAGDAQAVRRDDAVTLRDGDSSGIGKPAGYRTCAVRGGVWNPIDRDG